MPSMTGRIGFDNERYLSEQTAAILERVARFDNKLYLEFGGKLLFDQHAARVLPGYDPNVKMRLLLAASRTRSTSSSASTRETSSAAASAATSASPTTPTP